jgi:hypothetical protein
MKPTLTTSAARTTSATVRGRKFTKDLSASRQRPGSGSLACASVGKCPSTRVRAAGRRRRRGRAGLGRDDEHAPSPFSGWARCLTSPVEAPIRDRATGSGHDQETAADQAQRGYEPSPTADEKSHRHDCESDHGGDHGTEYVGPHQVVGIHCGRTRSTPPSEQRPDQTIRREEHCRPQSSEKANQSQSQQPRRRR